MGAAGSLDGNFRLAVRADLGGGSFGLLGFGLFQLGLGSIHELDDPEQNKCHEQEVDNCGNEVAEGDLGFADAERPLGEIRTAGDEAKNRHKDVIYEGVKLVRKLELFLFSFKGIPSFFTPFFLSSITFRILFP